MEPIVVKAAKDVSTHPLMKQMVQHLRTLYAAEDSPLQFDRQAYTSAKQQVEENPELLAKAILVGDAVRKEMMEEKKRRADAILAKVCTKGRDAMESCLTDKKVLRKLRDVFYGISDNDNISESDGREQESEDEYNEPIIHKAVITGDVEGLMKEISLGANIKEEDEHGRTALHLVCVYSLYGKVKCAKALIEAGIDLNDLDNYNKTPLHYAALNGRTNCVYLLLSLKADDTLRNTLGEAHELL